MESNNQIITHLNYEEVKWHIENGQLTMNKHPELDVYVLNYTPKVIFHKLWNPLTLICRGLVIDQNYKIIARPFKKFFYLNEEGIKNYPSFTEFDVTEIIDGSFIIAFYYNNQWIFSTKNSFISDQAKMAYKFYKKYNFEILNKSYTHVFEIIYKQNRIVVDYGSEEGLIMIAAIETQTGHELLHEDLIENYGNYFNIVNKININSLDELEQKKFNNNKGFVIRFLNGERFKWKFPEYMKLYRVINNTSTISVWEYLKNGYDINELSNYASAKNFENIKKITQNLKNDYNFIEKEALKEFVDIFYNKKICARKDFAEYSKDSKYRHILFLIFDKQNYEQYIWNMIKPDYSNSA